MTEPKKQIDWDSVELEYRAGIRSLKAIGVQFGVSDAGILKRAKRDGWERDLKARIQAATEAKLAELAIPVSPEVSEARLVSEAEIVDANSDTQVEIVFTQRKDIKRARDLGTKLFNELESLTDNRELFAHLGELMHAPDEKGKDRLHEIYQKVISMPGRVGSYKQLTDAVKTMIGLERQAYGLADNANGEADKQAEAPQVSDTEAARRIAFAFAKAMKKEPA